MAREQKKKKKLIDHPRAIEQRNQIASRNFLNPKLEWRRVFAEIWGTFLLVLVAAGGEILRQLNSVEVTRSMTAMAPGLMVMVVIYFMGEVSGAHLNPAVTLAFAIRRNFPWIRVPGYIAAQLCGAILAMLFLQLLFGPSASLGATHPGKDLVAWKALATEIVLTAGLVNTILGTASGARNVGANGALAVGGYIILAGLWSSTISGASMNPARSIAPDLVSANWQTTWIYVVGPFVGALIGVLFEWILKGGPTKAGTRAAQGTLDSRKFE